MGLLDYLFNPGTYGDQAGGLLARLAPMTGAIPQSQGFPDQPGQHQANSIPVGDYQMPRVGPQAAFTPQTPTDVSAQSRQPQTMQQPEQLPSFLQENRGGIGAGLRGFANNLHTGPIGALVGGVGSAFGMQNQSQQDTRALFNAYKAAGLDPSKATLAVMNPKLAENMLGMGGQTDDIKEYQFAKKEDPALTFEKFMQRKRAVSGEYGMQPIWGTGPDGKPAVLQLGKSGDAKQSVLPPGFNLARDPIKVEGPTGTTILDPQTRQQVGFIPKDVAGKEAAEKVGQARGTAQAALANGADIDAEQTKKKIDDLIGSKGFNEVFGQLDQYRPKWTHSNAGADALARYEQLTGVAFLSAYQMLKGGGAITDIEGQKAGAAMARLNRAQSEAEAKQALEDFKEAVDIGLQKLKRAAGGDGSTPAATSAAPKRIRINANGTVAQ